jgi:hypothetical protein
MPLSIRRHPNTGAIVMQDLLLFQGPEIVGAPAEEEFRGFHHGFGQRGVGVNGELEIGRHGCHLQGKHPFSDHLAGASPGNAYS